MSDPDRERVLSWPLVGFLLAVVAVLVTAISTRYPRVDLDGAIELLADGDLDRQEREHILLQMLELAPQASSTRQRWGALMAAVALQDREAFAAIEAGLGDGPSRLLPADQRRWLDLGDPLLANVLAALLAQDAQQEDLASMKWQQVAAQARVTGHGFAAELAQN